MTRRYLSTMTVAVALAGAGCSDDKKSSTDAASETIASSESSSQASSGTGSPTTAPSTGDTGSPTTAPSTGDTGSLTTTPSTSDTGDCGACGNPEHICCAGACVDPRSDRNNCGGCGMACSDPTPFCGAGSCAATPCDTTCGASETCCATACCTEGTICCQIDGPVQSGPGCVAPTEQNSCPPGCSPLCQCAAPDTPIATPDGERAIADLRVGDLVYSVDGEQTVAVPIAAIRRTPVVDHQVVRVVLADGSRIEMSGSHPLGDGRSFADLRAGDRLGGHALAEAALVPYEHAATHDILPASDTGTYFVRGILVGSTLAPSPGSQGSPEPRRCAADRVQ
ncbi:hypothetical protein [Nannocystis sp.]|uniref:hypothetical protein n=1 Tax=Nannocystis sp. TaxID=1962667 RepID=UPI0024256029|nr:hypothetical protein [Nannocystis sp.]MBK7828690.1 hypothetical protein [Nannocystis sp.]MBK9754007.1 hypothetical protein [Nannocystis sp.]